MNIKVNWLKSLTFLTVILFIIVFPAVADTSKADYAKGWKIILKSLKNNKAIAISEKDISNGYSSMKLPVKGKKFLFEGPPLSKLIGLLTGGFDKKSWLLGYDITVTAGDGYSVTFNTREVDYKKVIVALKSNGKSILPMLTGEISKSLWVKNIEEIEIGVGNKGIGEVSTNAGADVNSDLANDFKLIFQINNKEYSYTIHQLEDSPLYVEGYGSYTTSAGSVYSGFYGGVELKEFLDQFVRITKDSTIIFRALDGYEVSYSGKDVIDESHGIWILAFKKDGEYLPKDPGYVRTIKIAVSRANRTKTNNSETIGQKPKDMPNIDGHLSVRMIKRIIVSGEEYKDYSLQISGKMSFVLDRQTLESGLSCHGRKVFFKRKGKSATYMGIPLWRLLAYADDPLYAPHKQKDKSVKSYNERAARTGYKVKLIAKDGYSITLDSKELNRNDDVILAIKKNGETLPDKEWPLILVWDKDAKIIPSGIKPIRQIVKIKLVF